MIQTILQALDQAAAEHLPVGARYLLVEQQRTGTGVAPHRYDGNGRWTPIANDNAGTFSYWRLTSPIKEQEVDAAGCYDVFEAVYSLRLVAMVDRSLCPDLIDVARGAATAVRGTDDGIRASLKLRTVDFGVSSVEVNSQRVYTQEFGGTLDVNPDKALVSIDIAVTITGKSNCFAPCEATADYLCGLIEAQTWQRIKGCMTEAQIAAAIADLCVGSSCDFDITVNVNGVFVETIPGVDPCVDNTLNITITA
jgi:hypothetical protein